MFNAVGQYQSSNETLCVPPQGDWDGFCVRTAIPGTPRSPSSIFPSRAHTYPARCQVHISIVQNVQRASSKAYKLCRGRKLTFISKTERAQGSTSEPLLSSSIATRPESGWIPCSNCVLSSYTVFSLSEHLDWALCSTPLKHLPLP